MKKNGGFGVIGVFVALVLIAAVGSAGYLVMRAEEKTTEQLQNTEQKAETADDFGRIAASGIDKQACMRSAEVGDERSSNEQRCYDLKGTVYIMSVDDTEEVVGKLLDIVEQRMLDANEEFNEQFAGDREAFVARLTSPEVLESGNDDPRIVSSYISLLFSGGLFGVDSFPVGADGALYVNSFYMTTNEPDSNNKYVLRSEFGVDETEAEQLVEIAKNLQSDEYLLFVAQ